jgi:hypothetical protein
MIPDCRLGVFVVLDHFGEVVVVTSRRVRVLHQNLCGCALGYLSNQPP